MVKDISIIAKSQIDFFSGAEGDSYTERNKENFANCGSNIIYNCVKLTKSKSVIEVGCGVGNNLSRISDISQITGVDINKKEDKLSIIYLIEGKKEDINKIPDKLFKNSWFSSCKIE